jgi:hypothetical protein
MTRRPPDPASPERERAAESRPENHAATAAQGLAPIRPISEHHATGLMQRLGARAGAAV